MSDVVLEPFDAHAHLAPGADALRALLTTMDECGIARAVVVGGGVVDPVTLSRQLIEGGGSTEDVDNDAVLRGCALSGGRLVPFFFANPHSPGSYREHAAGFRGLKLAPGVHGVGLADPRTAELVDVAREVGHPVYLHCLDRPGSRVVDLTRLATRFPTVSFILGHGGIGDLDLHGVELVAPHENVLFETSGGYTCVTAAALRRLGVRRVLFGTEYPLQHPRVELERFRVLDLSEQTWRCVGRDNIARLIGEEAA